MTNTLTLVLTAVTLGQIGLVLTIFIVKSVSHRVYRPLVGFFVAICVLLLPPIAKQFLTEVELFSIVFMLPALLSLAPLLWLYVRGMTEIPGQKTIGSDTAHFVLPVAGLVVSILTAILPTDTLKALLTTEDAKLSVYVGALMICAFVLVLSWLAQSTYYAIRIIRRIQQYHRNLNHYFANNESRQMRWMFVMAALLVGIWLFALVAVFVDNVFHVKLINSSGATLMAMIWVWSLSSFALFQSPGFEDEPANPETPADDIGIEEKKYQRSALDKTHSERIAQKLDELMKTEEVYLDPTISLSKLAKLTGISANYVSQTLNETLEQSFFDYINAWRIRHAKPLLAETEKTILDIAFEVGFNARSSFYKSFKQFTNQTPSQFRRLNKT